MSDMAMIKRLESQASELRRQAQRYEIAASVLREELGLPARSSAAGVSGLKTLSGASSARPMSTSSTAGGSSVLAYARHVLKQADGPLELQELTDRMLAKGWQTESANPSNTLRTSLMRWVERGILDRNEDGRYSLVPAPRQAE